LNEELSMNLEEAQKHLADLLEPVIEASKQPSRKMLLGVTDASENYRPLAESMAKSLLEEALSNGVSDVETGATLSELGGGAASDFVFRARSNISVIVKVQRDVKLKNEAVFLKSLQPEVQSATAWGALFPRVLAMQVDNQPYAYAMEDFRQEDGYKDLSKWIFEDKLLPDARIAQSKSLLNAVLDCIQPIYLESRDTNSKPTLDGDAFLGRIRTRMTEAESFDEGFKAELVQTGRESLYSWKWQLEEIEKRRSQAEAFLPGFQTAVHGDSHPGNIIVRLRPAGPTDYKTEIRLIDPRGWHLGDYVFDFAKLGHYLILIGPIEKWSVGSDCTFNTSAKTFRIGPIPEISSWLHDLERMVFNAAKSLGESMGDTGVEARYELAMASCLLGSVPLRWKKDQKLLAVLMYAEGLKWLNKFRLRLG
jgi:hypothetical protein